MTIQQPDEEPIEASGIIPIGFGSNPGGG